MQFADTGALRTPAIGVSISRSGKMSREFGRRTRANASNSTRIIGFRLILSRRQPYDSTGTTHLLAFTEEKHGHYIPGNQEVLSAFEGSASASWAPSSLAGPGGHRGVRNHGRRRELGGDCRLWPTT